MGKKLTKAKMRAIQEVATELVEKSGVKKRIPAKVVYKMKRSAAVKKAAAMVLSKDEKRSKKTKSVASKSSAKGKRNKNSSQLNLW